MRSPRDDDHDIRVLFEHGSSSWRGPSPFARQSTWAREGPPRRMLPAGLVAAACGLAVLLVGSLTLVATSQTPNDAAARVVRLVSHVFTTPPPGSPAASPAPSPPISAPPVPGAAPTPSGRVPAVVRPVRPQTPEPERSAGSGLRSPSPLPSPSGSPGPGSSPTPIPSPTDE